MKPVDRRYLLHSATALLGLSLLTPAWSQPAAGQTSETTWHDVQEWGVEGKGWSATTAYFDRLPAKAAASVRPAVWNLSRHSAGMLVQFETNAPHISVDYRVTSSQLAMPHMPATGVSGVDLYAQDDSGHWRWLAVSRPTAQTTTTQLISGLPPQPRQFRLYLPLYNGVEYLKIGVPSSATFKPVPPRAAKPIVFYGTSITHGACASRPGMPHPAILGRRLDVPVINLGFSGNGKMEAEVGTLLAELDASVFVIDCLPNMIAAEIEERAVPLVQQLRAAHPDTPIVLVEDRTYANAPFLPARQQRHETSRRALQTAYTQLLQAQVSGLAYVAGEQLLGEDRDDTTDGSHPSDLGFYRQADALEPVLRDLLHAQSSK